MAIKLTWADLLVQRFAPEDARRWLEPWTGFVTGPCAPIAMSKFGDWFLRRPDGSTDELSVIEGTLTRIATTADEFARMMNTPGWQETHLLSRVVLQLHERGLVPAEGQCYAFAPHPLLAGKIDSNTAAVMSTAVWQSICAQTVLSSRR